MAEVFTIYSANNEADLQRAVVTNAARGLPSPKWGAQGGAISVCGNGPSLRETYPRGGIIAALNGAWRTLAARGVMPDYVIVADPSPENVAWFKDAPAAPVYLLASVVHPIVFEALRDKNVVIWHAADKFEAALGEKVLIGGGFTVGCRALNLLNMMGFEHFNCFGYDSCYALTGEHHSTPQPWGITPPRPYQVGERMFIAEPWMAAQVQEFLVQVEQNRFNYTVDVKGDGFLATALEHNTLNVVYDLDVAPGSFDFMCSMMNVENYRQDCRFSRVRVYLKPGKHQGFRKNEPIDIGHFQKNRMLNNVVRPLLEMFGFQEVGAEVVASSQIGGIETIDDKWVSFPYSPRPSVEKYKATGALPEYRASDEATRWAREMYPDRPYVITLREAKYWPQRNSNVAEWMKFATTLPGRVVFLRDTDKAGEPVDGFETCPDASVNLHKRLALYRQARMNFFVTNGPGGLAWYSRDIPYLNFQTTAAGYHCYDEAWMEEYIGIPPKGQYAWASDQQRMVYAEDTCDNIAAAFEQMNNAARKVA